MNSIIILGVIAILLVLLTIVLGVKTLIEINKDAKT